MAEHRVRIVAWTAFVTFPLAGLSILLAAPHADVRWENHPSHFWLVLGTSIATAILAYATGEVAARRGDGRLFLVSLGFLAAAGFLGLHALATPKVLLDAPNGGFVLATPVGPAGGRGARGAERRAGRDRHAQPPAPARRPHRPHGAVGGRLAGRDRAAQRPDAARVGLGAADRARRRGIALYGYAALRYAALYRRRRSAIIVAVVTAFILLAEAMVAVAFARNWHASWWEWHVLMLAAFALIALAARAQGPAERFSDLYLEATAAGKRDVSVIFADLAGFTAFSDGRDPRAVSEMLNAYFEAAIPAVVRHHGGEIDQLIGDAMMATFNTRGDQPDHAQRAAAAALDVQRETAALAAAHPDWPRFRIGVNTGEALVGILGAGEGRSYTVVGDTVNVASRLQAAAPSAASRSARRPCATCPEPGSRASGRWSCAASATRSTPTCSRRCAERCARRRAPWPRR